jgi:hypothetical protein
VAAFDLRAHEGEVTAVSFAPSDAKFVSSSDDQVGREGGREGGSGWGGVEAEVV